MKAIVCLIFGHKFGIRRRVRDERYRCCQRCRLIRWER